MNTFWNKGARIGLICAILLLALSFVGALTVESTLIPSPFNYIFILPLIIVMLFGLVCGPACAEIPALYWSVSILLFFITSMLIGGFIYKAKQKRTSK